MLRIAIVLGLAANVAYGQQPGVPVGVHDYVVHGVYEGEEMPGWDAQSVIADSLIAGTHNVHMAFNSRRDGAQWKFSYSSLWRTGGLGSFDAVWDGVTPDGPGSCSALVRGDTVTVNGRRQVFESVVPAPLVPEFALGPVIASLPLEAGAVLRLRPFRCSLSDGSLRLNSLNASVSAAEHPRGNRSGAEPAWHIRGDAAFPYEVVVSRIDGLVLREVIPQGSVGIEVREYAGSRSP